MTYTTDDRRADLRSLRRVAQQLRADRDLRGALRLEEVIREREADLESAVAAEPTIPFTIAEMATIRDGAREGVTIVSGSVGNAYARITAMASGDHAQERAGWFALKRAMTVMPSPDGQTLHSARRPVQLAEEWSWRERLTGEGEWVMDSGRRES